jgi:hypothetical protein
MTVFVYVNTSKQVGGAEHIKVFANADAAETWFEENDPEGVAFEYDHEKRAHRVAQARSRLDHPVRPDNAVIHSGAYGNGLTLSVPLIAKQVGAPECDEDQHARREAQHRQNGLVHHQINPVFKFFK